MTLWVFAVHGLTLGMTLCMAVMMLIIRRHHETPMLPAACLSALLCPLLVWPFAAPFDVSTIDLLKLFLFGTTQFGLGLVFLTVVRWSSPRKTRRSTRWKRGMIVGACLA